jgi:hypothetical protein
MRILLAGLFLLATVPAIAAPLSTADKARLEGVWRSNGNPASDGCGTDGKFLWGVEISIEFKFTGGDVYFEDQSEGSGGDHVVSSSKNGETITLTLTNRHPGWTVKWLDKNTADFDGTVFTHCQQGEPRTNVHLGRDDLSYLATGLTSTGTEPFYGVFFVDARDPGACKAKVYQALTFGLRSPTYLFLARRDSNALKTRLAAKKKPGIAIDTDGMGRWAIDGAQATPTGWRFTVADLVPPNGSRGDTTTLDVMRTKTGIAIPAWKRNYVRCTFS